MIPDEAVEAAWTKLAQGMDCDPEDRGMFEVQLHESLTAALEAAAPFLRAQALLDAADERCKDGLFVFGLAARQKLRARAVTERGGE